VDDVGRCWRPRVSIEWRPYWRGRWGAYAGGLTWISDDPWGYVTSHHGRWGWTSRWGWYWIPGVFYSPAWVAWNWSGGYCGWSPLSYWNSPCNWGYGAWNGGYAWNVVSVNHINQVNIHNRVVVDRNVLAGFNGGTGTTTWQTGQGRGVTPPWRTSPVIATGAEFKNPGQFNRALDRQVQSDRLNAYGRQLQTSGHQLQTRTHVTRPTGEGEGGTTAGTARAPRPFEDRSLRVPGPRGRDLADPTGTRGTEQRDGGPRRIEHQDRSRDFREEVRPVERRPDRTPDRNPDRTVSPRTRDHIERPDDTERRMDVAPRERRLEERRPDPPRERPREERQEWRQERIERPREERRIERPEPPARYERPEPRPEPRYERPAPPPRAERPPSPPPPAPRMERPSSPPPSAPPPRSESREIRRH
jgi:hypothetical protein